MGYTDKSYFYRNHSSSDTINISCAPSDNANFFPNVAFLAQATTDMKAPDGYFFKEWNSARDGSGISRQPGDGDLQYTQDTLGITQWYAIWLADNYIVSGSDLLSVADAIRDKAGVTSSLVFPSDFVSTISAMSTSGITPSGTINITENGTFDVTNYASASVSVSGGGGGNEDSIIDRTLHGEYVNSTATFVGAYAFQGCVSLTKVSFPNASGVGSGAFSGIGLLSDVCFPIATRINMMAFQACSALETLSFPEALIIFQGAFSSCIALKSVTFPKVTSVYYQAFARCSKLTSIDFPELGWTSDGAFQSCYSLSDVSVPKLQSISAQTFAYCSELATISLPKAMVLSAGAFASCRKLLSVYLMGSCVVSLKGGSGVFTSTPIAGYTTYTGGAYGSIYVPASLYSTYIASSGWSYFAARFVSV